MADDDAIPTELGEPAEGGHTPELSGATEHGAGERSSGEQVVTQPGQRSTRLALPPGTVLGRYRVLDQLGRGGMGIVLRAHDEVIGRTIALKVLHSEDDRHALRLKREAQAMAQLSHPNIVQVYEVGKAEGHWFIAMELVEGETLRRWQQGAHDWRARLRVYLQAGEGLAAAHAAGLVHRDFKPDNCIVDRSGRPRVLDFGLVRGTSSSWGDESVESHTNVDPSDVLVTRTGAVLGTVAYMSLEQLSGRAADARSDQFAFCVALYEALYGERPFTGTTVGRLTMALMSSEIRPAPRGTPVPERVRRVVLRGLLLEPAERWPSMEALLGELRSAARPQRAGRWAATTAGAIGVLAGMWLLWPQAEAPSPCADARAQLDGVWDDGRRHALEAAILGTELAYAQDTWDRIEHELDEHASAWVDEHTEACEATNVRREQAPEVMDLRMRCLGRRRAELQEAVEVLTEASPERVQRGVALVSDLPEPSLCRDVEALRAERPPPEDPEVAAQVEALFEQLALVRSLDGASEHERALAEVVALTERAEALGYAPLLADALYWRGSSRSTHGEYAEAEADLERAYLLAVELRDDRLAARAVAQLTYVVGSQRAEHERGLRWSKTGLALAERLGGDPKTMANLLDNTGIVLAAQGKLDEALDVHRRALVTWEDAGGRPLDIAKTLGNIAGVLTDQGELDQALEQFTRVLTLCEGALGPRHPKVGATLNNIGAVLAEQGKFDEALQYYRRALPIWERAYGPEHPNVGNALANISTVLLAQGETEQAREHLVRALAIWEHTLGPQHPQVGQLHANLGNVLRSQGKLESSLEHLRRALGIMEESLGPDHPDLGLVLDNIGMTLVALDRPDEAARYYQRAIATWERSVGPTFPRIAMPLVGLAEIALAQGDQEAARAFAERALELREQGEVAAGQLAQSRFLLARILGAHEPRARALAEQALATFEEVGGYHEPDAVEAKAWLREAGAVDRARRSPALVPK